MYAPVITRFTTYGIELSEVLARYRTMLYARPAMQRWIAEAQAEITA